MVGVGMWYVGKAQKSWRYQLSLEDKKLFASYGVMREIASQIAGNDHTKACYLSDRLPRGKDPQKPVNLLTHS